MDAMTQPRPPAQHAGQPTRNICFLYIAQAHQVAHSLSAAFALARQRPDVVVTVAATSAAVLDYARRIAGQSGRPPIAWQLLGPGFLRALAGARGAPPKVPMLAANAGYLNSFDVIVTPERTTAALRWMGVRRPKLVYTQHGAGDRGGPFEPRLRRFDLVFAPGAKQRDRMLAEGLVQAERCAIVGYPKFALVQQLGPPAPRLFDPDRPVVLYNPHFDPRLSSWPRWGLEILRTFSRQSHFNLIFAPHMRLFEGRTVGAIDALAPYVGHHGIHIDLGDSDAAFDMTYTRQADIYLGDASSQIYEFLTRPRPCLMLDAHHADWVGQESYRHWRFGPVLDGIGDLIGDIGRACRDHQQFAAEQAEGFRRTFDLSGEPASERAAAAISRLAPAKANLASASATRGMVIGKELSGV